MRERRGCFVSGGVGKGVEADSRCREMRVWTRATRRLLSAYWRDEVISAEVMNAAGTVRLPPKNERDAVSP